ncbi:hypothetical protein SSX86_000666 [Deinandra increscens subsp. villosa]|uniref:F-box domain-containing protein n=1 Tax=Deinandra increscens subsp. villosa TaxID=3103831 RepID=A0AAP0DU04_9ASTR
MDFDEYEYLEKTVAVIANGNDSPSKPKDGEKTYRRRGRDKDDGIIEEEYPRKSKKTRGEEENGRSREDRSEHHRSSVRDGDRDRSGHSRIELEREKESRESRKLKDKKEVVEPEADLERDQRTVFAYQMPLKATEWDVYESFSKAGNKIFGCIVDLLSEDIIYGILSRLPIKSLARFRSVCKLWLKYTDSPYLRTIHVKEEPTPIMFQKFINNKMMKISFLCGTTSLDKNPVLELSYDSPYETLLLGSCNGLALVSYQLTPGIAGTYRFAVINPLRKQRHDLPPISIKIRPRQIYLDGPVDASGFGYDDSTNTFKVVFAILKNPQRNVGCTMVHSLGMRSWRKISQIPYYPISGEGVFVHGQLHWLTTEEGLRDDTKRKIVRFDLKTEIFKSTLDPPKGCYYLADTQLVNLNGEVGFAHINPIGVSPIGIKLWILKKEEWVSHCCFDPTHILPNYYDYEVEVSGCWNKDGDILWTYNGGDQLFVYTLKNGDLREVELSDPFEVPTRFLMYQSDLFSIYTNAYSIKG